MKPLRSWPMLLLLVILGCGSEETMPTMTVEASPFSQRVTAEGLLKAAQVTPVTVPPEVRGRVRLAWLAADGRRVEEGEVLARFDPKDMEDLLVSSQTELTSTNLTADKTRYESQRKMLQHETALEMANLELDHAQRFQKMDQEAFSHHEIVEDQIDEGLAQERRTHAIASRETQEDLNRTELDLLAIRRRQATMEIDRAEKALAALEIRAPHAGILTLERDWRGEIPEVGSQMWRGQKIGEIPDLGKMEAEVYVLEADAGGLEVGKAAQVVLEAHPETIYSGRIRRVDAVAKQRFRGSPVQYFGVSVEIDAEKDEGMKPGQRVRATLLLEEIDQALVVPRQAVFGHGDGHRVYVRNGSGFAPRDVEIGARSMGLLVITDGLSSGDVIALREPPRTGTQETSPNAPSQVAAGEGAPGGAD